jgi:seryl-tRNA synthetase
MLDIALLRRDLPHVVARLQTRKNPQPFLDVDQFQALENERKTLQTRTEALQAKRNSLSKEIGQRKAKGEFSLRTENEITMKDSEILDRIKNAE